MQTLSVNLSTQTIFQAFLVRQSLLSVCLKEGANISDNSSLVATTNQGSRSKSQLRIKILLAYPIDKIIILQNINV